MIWVRVSVLVKIVELSYNINVSVNRANSNTQKPCCYTACYSQCSQCIGQRQGWCKIGSKLQSSCNDFSNTYCKTKFIHIFSVTTDVISRVVARASL